MSLFLNVFQSEGGIPEAQPGPPVAIQLHCWLIQLAEVCPCCGRPLGPWKSAMDASGNLLTFSSRENAEGLAREWRKERRDTRVIAYRDVIETVP